MKKIPVGRSGHYATVDDCDYSKLIAYRWSLKRATRTSYAIAHEICNHDKSVLMHRVIMSGVKEVDHVDGNGLNNTRQNLRSATRSQNQMNVDKKRGFENSIYKGVDRVVTKREIKFRARIRVNNKLIHLGYYPTEEIAAEVYNSNALRLHGEFARPNIISSLTPSHP